MSNSTNFVVLVFQNLFYRADSSAVEWKSEKKAEIRASNLDKAVDTLAARRTKFYIMAGAATGKSTFAGKHETYRGCHIVDYAQRISEFSPGTKLLLYVSRRFPPARRMAVRRSDMALHFKGACFE